MKSFRISLSPSKRAAGRFIAHVRRELQKALLEEGRKRGLTQSDVARTIDVHRSVVNRELRGAKDITVGRIAELAYAMGRRPTFALEEIIETKGANEPPNLPSFQTRSDVSSGEVTLPNPISFAAEAA